MRIGICSDISNIFTVEKLGFDYIEWSVSRAASLSEEEFTEAMRKVNECSIKPEACNVFFAGDIALTGPDINENALDLYIKRALERVGRLGTKITVVGSGKARNIPEGWDRQRGLEQFGEALRKIGEEARQYGIMAVVEPLNRKESNIVNSVTEGLELVKAVNHPNVRVLADFYHMRLESESTDGVIAAGGMLKHTHIANSNGRIFPRDRNEDRYDDFFRALKQIGYCERISIEASAASFEEDAVAALKLLRELDACNK